MSTIIQRDSAAKLVDAISSACNDESVKATLQNDALYTNIKPTQPKNNTNHSKLYDDDDDDGDVDDVDASFEEYAGSDDISPTDSPLFLTPLPLTHVRPALSQLTAAARLIDRLSASYDAEDAQDLLGDTNAWHAFEDYTETIDALYDRYRTALYEFADAAGSEKGGGSRCDHGQVGGVETRGQKEEEGEGISVGTYQEGMLALARVLRGSCDPLPYRLRQVHTALVGSGLGERNGQPQAQQQHREVVRMDEEARVLLRAANDRCMEEADDFLAYYVTVRRLFLHLVASEAKAVMVMAVALQHGGIPHYIHPSDVTIARQLLAEQDAFLDRVVPATVARLSECVLTSSSSSTTSSPAVKTTLRPYNNADREVRPSTSEGSEVVICTGSSSSSNNKADQNRPFVWTLEAAQPLPRDGDAVGRYTFRIRSGPSSTSSSSSPPTYLECDDEGEVVNVTTGDASSSGTWRIAAVQVQDRQRNGNGSGNGKAVAGSGARMGVPVAFRLQYRSADGSRGKSHGKWLASTAADEKEEGARLGLRELEEQSQDLLFDINPVAD